MGIVKAIFGAKISMDSISLVLICHLFIDSASAHGTRTANSFKKGSTDQAHMVSEPDLALINLSSLALKLYVKIPRSSCQKHFTSSWPRRIRNWLQKKLKFQTLSMHNSISMAGLVNKKTGSLSFHCQK